MAGGSPLEQNQPKDVFEAAFSGGPMAAFKNFMREVGTSPSFNTAVSEMSSMGNVASALAKIDGNNRPEVV